MFIQQNLRENNRLNIHNSELNISSRGPRQSVSYEGYLFILLGVISLVAFLQIGNASLDNYRQSLFFFNIPDVKYTYFMLLWSGLGGSGAILLAIGFSKLKSTSSIKLLNQQVNNYSFLIVFSLLTFIIPLFLNVFVFDGAYLTDDESAYEYSARAIVNGSLYFDSPESKLFYDRAFMINDGKFYSQYFLGWPALFALGIKFGIASFINPILSALSILPIYKIATHFVRVKWAKLIVVLFMTSPSVILMASTKLSHTSCVFALLWCSYHYLQIHKDASAVKNHSLFAIFFSIAFFIRPLSALALALPLLLIWANSLLSGNLSTKQILSFIIPAIFFSGAFLLVNDVQNGSIGKVAYQRSIEYDIENKFRFSPRTSDIKIDKVANLTLKSPGRILETISIATIRHNFAIQGWPLFLVFAIFALKRKYILAWSMLISYSIFHININDAGFGSIAPVHFFEQIWLWMILVVAGLRELNLLLKCMARGLPRCLDSTKKLRIFSANFIPILVFCLITLSMVFYWPMRISALQTLTAASNYPIRKAEKTLRKPTIIFSNRPFVSPCISYPARLSMYYRPNSLPMFNEDILWVNNVGIEKNLEFLKQFPERHAYLMIWNHSECLLTFSLIER